jgi:hypothetical protein
MTVTVTESQYREEMAFVDGDEMSDLVRGVDALMDLKANPTKFKNFEVRYPLSQCHHSRIHVSARKANCSPGRSSVKATNRRSGSSRQRRSAPRCSTASFIHPGVTRVCTPTSRFTTLGQARTKERFCRFVTCLLTNMFGRRTSSPHERLRKSEWNSTRQSNSSNEPQRHGLTSKWSRRAACPVP